MAAHITATAAPVRADRIAMRTIGVLAGVMALSLAAGQLTLAARYAWADTVELTLLGDHSLPVSPGGSVLAAGIHTVSLTTNTLDATTRAFYASGCVILAFIALAVGSAMVGLLFAAASGRPFRAMLYRFSLIAGLLLVVGPIAAGGLSGLAAMMAADQLNATVGGILLPGFEVSGWGMATPIVGMAVIALSYLLRRMEGLQRETDGLV